MLLVNSVRKIITMAILITKRGRGNDPTEDKFDPIHSANPELLTAVASDNPPPKNQNTHGDSRYVPILVARIFLITTWDNEE